MRDQRMLTAVVVFTKKIKNVIDEDFWGDDITVLDMQSYEKGDLKC